MMNNKHILVLTPIYPADDIPKGWTPVVHYFAREWVRMGFEVHVINYVSNFPKLAYWISFLIRDKLSSIVGYTIRTTKLKDKEYNIDGVNVARIMMRKIIPHKRYPSRQIHLAYKKTIAYCNKMDIHPIAILAHWANPQIELMYELKKLFNVPTCYVAHGGDHFSMYGKDAMKYWRVVDIIGFRSVSIKQEFETEKEWIKPSFMCYSGIPASYNNNIVRRDYKKVQSVAYVGTLIKRKYPAQIIPALNKVFGNSFIIKYAGEGKERESIKKICKKLNIEQNVQLLGRIDRRSVIDLLDNSDVFIMISEGETFGLVYLEAMARGCITIASRKEGFDGIIVHGVNGFLCDAGNSEELSVILRIIKEMTPEKRQLVSQNAMATARELTDEEVAKEYLRNVLK